MTKLASMGRKLNEVLAHEYAPEFGYCRATVKVTVEAGMDIGAALKKDGTKYTWIKAADVAALPADVCVLIEAGFGKDVPKLTPGDYDLTVLVAGPSAVKDTGLLFKDALNATQKATVLAALKAKGIASRSAEATPAPSIV